MKQTVLLFFLLAAFCQAQHEDLLGIINSDFPLEVRQRKIDSFLNVHEKSMPPEILADCYHDLGSKWYYTNWLDRDRKKDILKAIDHTQKALKKKESLEGISNPSVIKTLNNLSFFYTLNNQVFESIKSYVRLIELDTAHLKTKFAYHELGKAYNTIGDFHKALSSFNEILVNDSIKNDISFLLLTHISMANTFSLMGYEEYSAQIKFHISKVDSLLKTAKIANTDFDLQINQIEGNRLLSLGRYNDALGYHTKVLRDSATLSQDNLARVYNSLGFSEMKLENFDKALVNFDKAISLDSTNSIPYENFGDWHLAQNEFKKGLWFYQKAIVYATDRTKEIVFDDLISTEEMQLSPNKISLLNHIVTKANGWLQYYERDKNKEHLEEALKTFDLADQLVDIIRAYSSEQQSKLFWREKGASLYMKAVEVCHLLNRPEEAFYFMERNKALLLLEDVTNEQAKEIARLPESIAKREFELKRAILLAENELQNVKVGSEEKEGEIKELIYGLKQRYEQFADSLAINFPEYADLKKKVEVLSFKDFKKTFVSDGEAVLQYILNDEHGYGLLNSKGETFFFELGDTESLNNEIIDLYGRLTALVSSRERMAELHAISNSVFKKLIPEDVYQRIKGKKLTVVSDYILQQLPFETLVTDSEKGTYLVEDLEIRYAYSMSYLQTKDKIPINPEKGLLGLAPINFDTLDLPELAFSGEEVIEVRQLFDGRALLENEATKKNFLENLNDYRIIHLSTHADIGEKQNHWIAFNDGKLFLNEVYANKNQADMVVLSACNTSLGELKKGEGVMSLARGFFHSGAKSVVSSLWTTNDKASKDIISTFYGELGKGLTKSAALRNAKVNYIDKYRGTNISPAHWGALIVIGDNAPIQTAGFFGGLGYWLIGILLAMGAVLFYFLKKR